MACRGSIFQKRGFICITKVAPSLVRCWLWKIVFKGGWSYQCFLLQTGTNSTVTDVSEKRSLEFDYTNIQVLYIVRNLRTRPTHLITYWVNIRWLLNPTLINRVNKLMTNNIRSTFNCITFLESSGQFDQTIYRDNIWDYLDSVPKFRVNLAYFDPTSKKWA